VDAPVGTSRADESEALNAPAVPFLGRRSHRRPGVESLFVRLIATSGVIGLAVAIAAILGTQSVSAWIIGLVASLVSVVLAAVLWSSRTL
jgi:prepilin signal peptidase PulO-like enzyme (type II secretory pathway)